MIPEVDQIFTEVELSTLEKAINETTVREVARGAQACWCVGGGSSADAPSASFCPSPSLHSIVHR